MPCRNAKIIAAFVVAAAVWLLAVSTAFAQMGQLFEDFGIGPRDAGMGNTGTAAADDYSAVFYNPAALVRVDGLNLDLGYKGVYPHLHMKIGNYHDRYFTQYPNTNFFVLGFGWNLKIERFIDPKYTERFSVGLAVALSDYYKSFAVFYDEDTPYFFRYHDRYLNLLSIYLSMSFRIFDWFSIGGGIVPAPSDTYTDVTVNSNFRLPDYEYWADQGTITRSYGKLEPVLGVLFRIPNDRLKDYLSIGLTWRDEVYSIDGNGIATDYTKVHFEGQTISLPPSDTPILTLTGWTPMQVIGGVAIHPIDGMTLTVEELWKRWSRWKNFFIEHPDPRFSNTWNTRMGGEQIFDLDNHTLDSFTIRAGIYRELSPAPNQNGESNYIDPDKWVFTFGFDAAWNDPFDIMRIPIHTAVAGQAHLIDKVRLHNNQDPDYPALDAWGEIYSFTGTVGIDFK